MFNALMVIPNALARGVIRIAEPKDDVPSIGEEALCYAVGILAVLSFLGLVALQ